MQITGNIFNRLAQFLLQNFSNIMLLIVISCLGYMMYRYMKKIID